LSGTYFANYARNFP